MMAVVVNDGLAYPVVTLLITSLLSLVAYLFRQISRANEAQARSDIAMATVTANLNALDARVQSLERRFDRAPWSSWDPNKGK